MARRKAVPPMPDVPERCPFCSSGDRREETWRGSPAYSFSCGTVFYENGEVAWRYFSCYVREKEREERAIREQLAAALAEAERLQVALVAAREVVEAARPIVNAEHDVDPVDVYYLREAIRRYDERCGGGDQ